MLFTVFCHHKQHCWPPVSVPHSLWQEFPCVPMDLCWLIILSCNHHHTQYITYFHHSREISLSLFAVSSFSLSWVLDNQWFVFCHYNLAFHSTVNSQLMSLIESETLSKMTYNEANFRVIDINKSWIPMAFINVVTNDFELNNITQGPAIFLIRGIMYVSVLPSLCIPSFQSYLPF